MVRTQIQLTEEQALGLRALAHELDTSMAELIRRAINDMLAKSGPMSAGERRRRLMSAAGKFHSGLTDVSERHDDYLAETYGEW